MKRIVILAAVVVAGLLTCVAAFALLRDLDRRSGYFGAERDCMEAAKRAYLSFAVANGRVPRPDELPNAMGTSYNDIGGRPHEVVVGPDGTAELRSNSVEIPFRAVFRVRDAHGAWCSGEEGWVSPPALYDTSDRYIVWVHDEGPDDVESTEVTCGSVLKYRKLTPGSARVEWAPKGEVPTKFEVKWTRGGEVYQMILRVPPLSPVHVRLRGEFATVDTGQEARKK